MAAVQRMRFLEDRYRILLALPRIFDKPTQPVTKVFCRRHPSHEMARGALDRNGLRSVISVTPLFFVMEFDSKTFPWSSYGSALSILRSFSRESASKATTDSGQLPSFTPHLVRKQDPSDAFWRHHHRCLVIGSPSLRRCTNSGLRDTNRQIYSGSAGLRDTHTPGPSWL